MSEYYDPSDHVANDDRHEWEMQTWLRAQRRLRQLEGERPSGRNLLVNVATSDRCCRPKCSKPGRLIRLTGDVICPDHDPLLRDDVRICTECGKTEIELCRERDNGWRCSAGIKGHGWAHRMTILEGGADGSDRR